MKRFYALLCAALLFCLCPAQAFASGQGNLDGGGGNMNQGTSTNFWSPGNDGVRVTVVDAQSGSAVSTPVDFSNRSQAATMLHFGKVNKIQYRDGASLSLQSGVPSSIGLMILLVKICANTKDNTNEIANAARVVRVTIAT